MQMQLAESIVRQRDMYRMLLAQATGVSLPQPGNAYTHTETHPCKCGCVRHAQHA